MRIGTGLPNQVRNVRPAVLPAWALQAENVGFTSLATIGRNAYPGVSDTVALAAAAAVTSRIELVSGILLGPTWPATLLAKELAGIDGVSNGRLTVGLGVGLRPDDFVAEGYGAAGRGKRFDQDLARFREVWSGEPVGGGSNPAVPAGTRQVPMLFGGTAPAAIERMARWGEGYVGGTAPAPMVAPSFDAARDAWSRAGRDGSPRLVALAYYALGDGEQGQKNVHDYYSDFGDFADLVASAVCDTPQKVRETVASFKGIGAADLIFHASTDDVDDIKRLADIVL
jgi:alkanesulfonate monooxygenase SsuD/methylene tetrahydromethanopterin reductase-like flavin-dependent oxidoreductase (luciferase family)